MSYVKGESCGIGVQFVHHPLQQHDLQAQENVGTVCLNIVAVFSVTMHISFFRSVIMYGQLL